jgi:predicted transcriptional regulator
MKKETEETKINLNKLKDNVQNVVKKIKEEMTANKTEIHTELDKIKSDMFA